MLQVCTMICSLFTQTASEVSIALIYPTYVLATGSGESELWGLEMLFAISPALYHHDSTKLLQRPSKIRADALRLYYHFGTI